MATVEQIEREIAALEQRCWAIATEFHSIYKNYLTALGQAVRQQAIRASFHLCTQGYPEEFLSLSVNQRQQLQQDLRSLVRGAIDQLQKAMVAHGKRSMVEEHTAVGEASRREGIATQDTDPQLVDSSSIIPTEPEELAQWQYQIEQAISSTLKTLSREINNLFQQVEVLPKKLPSPLLDAAINSPEVADLATPTAPHLLNLLIETENNQESSESSITNIIAIHLRLAEIEFADTTVRSGRNQIRNLEAKVRSLSREYYKKQRERAVAEAEAAWRASWYED